jgi:hypothetical protein
MTDSLRCTATNYCAVVAPSVDTEILWLGTPDTSLTARCPVCATSSCARCAVRQRVDVAAQGRTFSAHRLVCPRCNEPFGAAASQHQLVSGSPALRVRVEREGDRYRLRPADEASVLEALASHEEKGFFAVMAMVTAGSPEAELLTLDVATTESPDDILAWYQKAMQALAAQHTILTQHALHHVIRIGRPGVARAADRWRRELGAEGWPAIERDLEYIFEAAQR